MSESNSEYAPDVIDMFRRLAALDAGPIEFRRHRDTIIERFLPLADHVARRFSHRGEPFDDLVQVARIGLVHAVNRFDADRGVEFVSFAVPTLMGEVRRYFRDHGWAVKVPRRLKELSLQRNRAREQRAQQLGRAPRATEIANHLSIDREEVIEAVLASSGYTARSSDAPAGGDDGEGRSIGDSLGSLDASLEKALDAAAVRPLLAALPEREQTILRLRFFENMTQTQIAKCFGISHMHVSGVLARSLSTLREALAAAERV